MKEITLDDSVYALPLSVRAANVVKGEGVQTIADFLEVADNPNLKYVLNCGAVTVHEIRDMAKRIRSGVIDVARDEFIEWCLRNREALEALRSLK